MIRAWVMLIEPEGMVAYCQVKDILLVDWEEVERDKTWVLFPFFLLDLQGKITLAERLQMEFGVLIPNFVTLKLGSTHFISLNCEDTKTSIYYHTYHDSTNTNETSYFHSYFTPLTEYGGSYYVSYSKTW